MAPTADPDASVSWDRPVFTSELAAIHGDATATRLVENGRASEAPSFHTVPSPRTAACWGRRADVLLVPAAPSDETVYGRLALQARASSLFGVACLLQADAVQLSEHAGRWYATIDDDTWLLYLRHGLDSLEAAAGHGRVLVVDPVNEDRIKRLRVDVAVLRGWEPNL